MSKVWRALLISAVATGAAAVVLKLIEPEKTPPPPPLPSQNPYVDADTMTPDEQAMLLQELDAQL